MEIEPKNYWRESGKESDVVEAENNCSLEEVLGGEQYMTDRVVDRIRARVDEVRVRGVVPTVRTRVEELVSQVRERVETGGTLTRETGVVSGTIKRKTKGL